MLDVDCHCETGALQSIFLFTGTRTFVPVRGFRYVDHRSWAAETILACDPHVEHVVLQDARIEIASFANAKCKVFDDPRKWKVTGQYSSRGGVEWNGGDRFTGFVLVDDQVNVVGEVGIKVQTGSSQLRPTSLGLADAGRLFMDHSINKLIVWSGAGWLDASGSHV
jgi:hypothetical protein